MHKCYIQISRRILSCLRPTLMFTEGLKFLDAKMSSLRRGCWGSADGVTSYLPDIIKTLPVFKLASSALTYSLMNFHENSKVEKILCIISYYRV